MMTAAQQLIVDCAAVISFCAASAALVHLGNYAVCLIASTGASSLVDVISRFILKPVKATRMDISGLSMLKKQ